MTDDDNTDDLALLASTPAPAESVLHSLELAAGNISFFVDANDKFMCFK